MENNHNSDIVAFKRLLKIMDELREQCPWDKKQTIESLRILTVEEVYELSDAIIEKDTEGIEEELGDILLHIVFYARIGRENKDFNASSLINKVCDKLIKRHPHIYGDTVATTEEDVKQNWEQIKLKEGKKSVLEGVPNSLPAVVKAYRVQEKVAQLGFDWEEPEQVLDKVHEELSELKEAVDIGKEAEIEEEFGDLVFSLINYARFLRIDPEKALELTNKKFMKRFQYMESKAITESKNLKDMTLAEMDVWWNEAKKEK